MVFDAVYYFITAWCEWFLCVARYFFVVLTGLLVIGLLNGAVLLPVLLSIMGPPAEVGGVRGRSLPPKGHWVHKHSRQTFWVIQFFFLHNFDEWYHLKGCELFCFVTVKNLQFNAKLGFGEVLFSIEGNFKDWLFLGFIYATTQFKERLESFIYRLGCFACMWWQEIPILNLYSVNKDII